MITKNDWDAALDAWIIAERERLGGPPTPEEVVAYTRGELMPAEAARVRALLVYYPELTELLTHKTPAPAQFKAKRTFRQFMPLAAGLLIALLTILLLQSRWELARAPRYGGAPYIHQSRHVLEAVRSRGLPNNARVYELPAAEERYLLALVIDERAYRAFRVDIVEASRANETIVWTANMDATADGTIELSVPRQLIADGTYRIDVRGVDAERAYLLESFHVRVQD
ncbi:MAG TPA: hypothetical protein VE010_18010 [Thermoanaerobaculia bacterium]|nr:hypothetical protein [Thermoanaerobaculia bacterium]